MIGKSAAELLHDLLVKAGRIPERIWRDAATKAILANPPTVPTQSGSGAMMAKLLGDTTRLTVKQPNPVSKEVAMQEWVRLNGNPNTRRTYESGWRGFERYLEEERTTLDRLRPCDIADYLRLRFEQGGVAASTIAGDRAAIGDGLKNTAARGMHLDPLVKSAMRICMNKAAQSKPKQHVSAELMRALVQQLDAKTDADWMDHRNVALLLTMMMGMLRESEAVEIRMEDVQVTYAEQAAAASGPGVAESVRIEIRGSKTDQAKKGASVILAANNDDASMCPVRRLHHYIEARLRAGVITHYLFSKNDGSAMAKSTPCGIVQRMVGEANNIALRTEGVEEKWGAPDVYGSHSLRRGGVTEARASGVEMLEIQRHGRWKSMAVWGYVGPTDTQRMQVTANIFGAGMMNNKKSVSAPTTPVKPPKTPRKPRASAAAAAAAVSPTKAKRKRQSSDDEDESDDVKEAERVEELLFMAGMQQGYGEKPDDAAEWKTKPSVKKAKTRITKAEAKVEEVTSVPARRAAAQNASKKMVGQR